MWCDKPSIGPGATGDGGGTPGVDRTIHLVRTLPTTIDYWVELGGFTIPVGGNLGLAISLLATVGATDFSASKLYVISVSKRTPFNQWLEVLPISAQREGDSGSLDEDFQLQINYDLIGSLVRLRYNRTVGITPAEISTTIYYDGVMSFAAATGTGTGPGTTQICPSTSIIQTDGKVIIGENEFLDNLGVQAKVVVVGEADIGLLNWTNAQLQVHARDNPERKLVLGLDTVADPTVGILQVGRQGVGFNPIRISPRGGGMIIGAATQGSAQLTVARDGFTDAVLVDGDGPLTIKSGSFSMSLRSTSMNSSNPMGVNTATSQSVTFGGRVGLINSPTAALDVAASQSSLPSMRIRTGVKPTVAVDGDIWADTNGVNYYTTADGIQRMTPKNRVFVHDIAEDFPAPDGEGYIVLEEKEYVIHTDITLDGTAGFKGFKIPFGISPTIRGLSTLSYVNQSAGVDALFKSVDMGSSFFLLLELNIFSDGSGRLFDIQSTDPDGFVLLNTVAVGGFANLGTIQTVSYYGTIVNYIQCIAGLTLNNNNAVFVNAHRFNDWFNAGATFVTISGTQQNVQINNGFFQPKSSEAALYLDPTMTTVGGAVVGNAFDSSQGGVFFAAGSKEQDDIYWTYAGNANLEDSTISAQGVFSVASPGPPTLIPVQGAKVLLNSPSWIWELEERIVGSSDGVIQYTGLEPALVNISGNVELQAGTNQDLRVQFVRILACTPYIVTFDSATNQVLEPATTRTAGDIISFYNSAGTLPVELRKDVLYYVINVGTDSFQISYTLGGPAVTFTDNGTPPNSYDVAELRGGIGRGELTGALQLVPQALIGLATTQQIGLVVWNDSTANDIQSAYAFFKVKK